MDNKIMDVDTLTCKPVFVLSSS